MPLSTNNNRYLLVIQDYFTKWADAIPLPDQTASRITVESNFSVHTDHHKYYILTKAIILKMPYLLKF